MGNVGHLPYDLMILCFYIARIDTFVMSNWFAGPFVSVLENIENYENLFQLLAKKKIWPF